MTFRQIAFKLVYYLSLPVLQTGADLASLYRKAPYWAKPWIKLAWYPVRGLGHACYWTCVAVSGVQS